MLYAADLYTNCKLCAEVVSFVLQSCKRNLSTLGKPSVIPGLPELASLVGQMASQWEHKAQQQALKDIDMANAEATTVDDLDAAVNIAAQPATAVAESNAEQPTAATEPSSGEEPGTLEAVGATEGTAVDESAAAVADDAVVHTHAAESLAGVAAPTSLNPDAAEARWLGKQAEASVT